MTYLDDVSYVFEQRQIDQILRTDKIRYRQIPIQIERLDRIEILETVRIIDSYTYTDKGNYYIEFLLKIANILIQKTEQNLSPNKSSISA